VKMFDADKTRMIGLYRMVGNCDNMLKSPFHLILERDGQTDGQADRIAVLSISRVSDNDVNYTSYFK